MDVQDFIRKINWLGHDGFRIEGEKTVYIDPYEVAPGPPADIILVTHEHFDHCSPADIDRLRKEDTVIVTEKDSAGKLAGDVRVVKPGDSITVGGIEIEAVPAYNVSKQFHPRARGWLGFIITMGGVRVYHAGDTDFIPEMKDCKTDIALLPVSGTYVMNASEAVEAATVIAPQVAIPMHYGAIVGAASDAEAFRSALEGKIAVEVLPKS